MNPGTLILAIVLGSLAGLAWIIAFFIISAVFILGTGSYQLVTNNSANIYEILIFGPALVIFISTLVIFLKKPVRKKS